MKRIFSFSFLLCCIFLSLSVKADVYLIGSYNSWGAGTKMSTSDDVTYTLTNYTLNTDTEFRFNTDGESVEQGTQYCSTASGFWLKSSMLGHEQEVVEQTTPGNTFIFKDRTGAYNITLNITTKKLTITPSTVNENALYMLGGNATDSWWQNGVKMQTTDYKTFTLANYALKQGTYFRFGTDANYANGRNYCSTSNNLTVLADRSANSVEFGENANFLFNGEDGNYNIVVNLTDKTVKVCPIPKIYVYDPAPPYVQVYNNSGTKTRGVSDSGDRLTSSDIVNIPGNSLDWYQLPIVADTYPVKVTVQHLGDEMNQNPILMPSDALNNYGAYPEPLGYFKQGIDPTKYTINADDDDLYFVSSSTDYKYYLYGSNYKDYYYGAMMDFFWVGGYDDAKNFRKVEVNVLKEEPYEESPVSDILYVSSGTVCFTGKKMDKNIHAYGKNWWRETNLEDDALNYTISQGEKSAQLNNVNTTVWYRWEGNELVEVSQETLDSWNQAPTDVTLYVEITEQLRDALKESNSKLECETWKDLADDANGKVNATTTKTADGKSWYTFTVSNADFASFQLSLGNGSTTSPKLSHLSGEYFYMWEVEAGTTGEEKGYLSDMTRFETQLKETLPDCALKIDGHNYIQYVDYNNWGNDNVYVTFDGSANWPGHKMTYIGESLGSKVYLLDLTESGVSNPQNLIFNNGKEALNASSEWHTGQMTFTNQGVYDYVGCLGSDNDLVFITSRDPAGKQTVIADDVDALFYDKWRQYSPSEGCLYVKDNEKSIEKSHNKNNKPDYMRWYYESVDEATGNDITFRDYRERYDQSTWAELFQATKSINLEAYKGKRIPGGNIHGYRITNDQDVYGNNPRFMVTSIDIAPEECPEIEYVPNVYTPAHFNANYVLDGMNDDAKFYFVAPKSFEYALIDWAVFDGTGFSIAKYTEHSDGTVTYIHNSEDLEGGMSAKWDMLQNEDIRKDYRGEWDVWNGQYSSTPDGVIDPPQDLKKGYSYRFHAIIKKYEIEYEIVENGWPYNVVGGSEGNGAPRRRASSIGDEGAEELEYKSHALSYYEIFPIDLDPETSIITAVEDVKTNAVVVGTEIYNLSGQQLSRPVSGVNIIVTRYSDGTRKSEKRIYR